MPVIIIIIKHHNYKDIMPVLCHELAPVHIECLVSCLHACFVTVTLVMTILSVQSCSATVIVQKINGIDFPINF